MCDEQWWVIIMYALRAMEYAKYVEEEDEGEDEDEDEDEDEEEEEEEELKVSGMILIFTGDPHIANAPWAHEPNPLACADSNIVCR